MELPLGEITVALLGERIIECIGRGHLCFRHVVAAQTEIERLSRECPFVRHRLYDATAIDSFEPGLPIKWVRWRDGLVGRPRRTAIVARPGPMLGIASTFRYLLPKVPMGLFGDRAAAIAFLECSNDVLNER